MKILAGIERGIVKSVEGEQYTVESLDRKGITTPKLKLIDHGYIELSGVKYPVKHDIAAGDTVYFILWPDGDGAIISKVR